ncbi:iron chelate uptake ABC transporter family permease subunit [Sinorhizobium sp. BG8]|uniref:FecCD family ABC transporter permease n=1 Tax=Sinorhizobium sp. BG8 TaxID=2613773 RepID=UPI001AF56878|nr:iron chelate uptake ABC transporter family permease subunit [Sinorhizobium sp. BG8]QRM54357.1 iron chelate uptake ABC transporter family permease subunit [Sinorhizobium sp. BG8]
MRAQPEQAADAWPEKRGNPISVPKSNARRVLLLVLGCALLPCVCLASLLVGARPVAVSTAIDALFSYDGSVAEHIIVRDYRLPRTLLGLLCGAAFGVSGALIQAATRNPLADPGILGVNAGAAFFVTIAVGLLGLTSVGATIWFAFLGAIVVTVLVYLVGASGRHGAQAVSPIRLALSGVAISAVLSGIGSSITLLDPQAFDAMRHWQIGTISGRNISDVIAVAPFIVFGLVLSLLAARSLNAVALGEDLSRSLGTDPLKTRLLVIVAVTLLCGAGTAAAGPISFVGLMVPHAVRWFTGPDQRLIIPFTLICSPILMLTADIAGRLVVFPDELEAGIVTAFLGAPMLIALVRSTRARAL